MNSLWRTCIALIATITFSTSPAHAKLDLSHASVERLDNGLTLILLEDRTLQVVSIQTVYRTGAKDDPAGRIGLAHFFEHMAFRGSKNFPDTGLVSEIYAVGGEWHGYTWLDLTTYFATTPKEHLNLLLDIEADRMARLDIRAEEVEAERGAVLAEMNGYANDPDSTLFDALIAAHFLTHPYRNNTIGYAADVNAIGHADLADFYRRHYAPQNAIIAIVGDFDRGEVRKLVQKKFSKIRKKIEPRAPLTAEIPRTGERRVRLSLPSEKKLFKIAYPASAASHPDFPAFLVLQALIGESAGVNFNQNDWGTPVGDNSPFAAAARDIRTWIIPTTEPYAFVISGSASAKADETKIEQSIQQSLDGLATEKILGAALADAKKKARAALAFDVDTTEEAAHQLAYFAGIGALDRLFSLEGDVDAVTAQDVIAIAKTYLRKDQRTIAWLSPGAVAAPSASTTPPTSPSPRLGQPAAAAPAKAPTATLRVGGAPVLFQQSTLSPTTAVKALIGGRFECEICAADELAFGMTTVSAVRPDSDLDAALRTIAESIETAKRNKMRAPSDDPITRLEETFATFAPSMPASSGALVIAISGDAGWDSVEDAVERQFPRRGTIFTVTREQQAPLNDIDILIDEPKAQAAVGYFAAAPGAPHALATRLALYVFSHGYEGRLGKEAISRRGLAYYIDAMYRGGIGGGAVTLAAGVDPEKVDAFRALMKAEIARLASEPPTDAEIVEAKRHLLGRKISAAQSNEEIADALIRDFLAVGRPESAKEFAARLEKVSREDVLNAVKALQKGAVVTVRGGGVD